MSTLELITETITSGSQASVSFTPIAATYRDLEVHVRARGTQAAIIIDMRMQYNNDSGANYDYETGQAVSTTYNVFSAAGQTSAFVGDIASANAPAGYADLIIIDIADYRGTTFQKASLSQNSGHTGTAAGNHYAENLAQWWKSTAAITRVDIFPSAGAFVDGSIVSLYGRM